MDMTDENLRAWSLERALEAGAAHTGTLIEMASAIFSYVRGDEDEDEDCPCEECEDEARMDAAREAAFVLFAALLDSGLDDDIAQDVLRPVADALDIEFYWEAEGVH